MRLLKKRRRKPSRPETDLTHTKIEPRRPGGAGWTRLADGAPGVETWANRAAGLLAETEVIATSAHAYRLTLRQDDGGRCTAAEVLLALVDFGLLDAQESNFILHGRNRIFVCPIDG